MVLVSHDGFNQSPGWRSLIVVPLTRASRMGGSPSAVSLPEGAANLPAPSLALCHQVTTLDRSRLGQALGSLSATQLAQVDAGLKAALALT